MIESSEAVGTINAYLNGGALTVLVTGLVVILKHTPKLVTKIVEQHDRMLDTFAANQDKERAICDKRFEMLIAEMRRESDETCERMARYNEQTVAAIKEIDQ